MTAIPAKKLALITGGTSGIGFGVAKALGAKHELALAYSGNLEKAELAQQELAALDIQCQLFPRPLRGYDDCKLLIDDVKIAFGRSPEILVNSHGRIQDGIFMSTPFAQHQSVVEELLLTTMALCQLVLKPMYGNRFGRIVNLSSISAFYAKRGQSNYAAAKAGILGFTKTLALEVAHRGVTINAVSPGLVATPMTQGILAMISQDESELKRRIPAGYAAEPKDVASLVAYLCSEDARYITGANFVIDGGRSLGDSGS